MNVGELISLLKHLPPDTQVLQAYQNNGSATLLPVKDASHLRWWVNHDKLSKFLVLNIDYNHFSNIPGQSFADELEKKDGNPQMNTLSDVILYLIVFAICYASAYVWGILIGAALRSEVRRVRPNRIRRY